MKEPEIVSRKRILDAFFAVDEIKLVNGDAEPLLRYLVIPKSAVAVILYRKDTHAVVFSKQYRFAVQKWLLEIPAGVIDDKSEKPEETAARECLEETGYEIGETKLVSTFFPSPGNSSEKIHLYYAEVKGKNKVAEGGGLADESEEIKVVEMNFDKALEMAVIGEITDGKTLFALFWLKNYLQNRRS